MSLTCPGNNPLKEEQKIRALILGHGEMGHALEQLLSPVCELRIWQRRPPPGVPPVSLPETVPDSDFILFCLPTAAHADLAARIRPLLSPASLCLTIGKGLDDQGRTPAELLGAEIPAARIVVLYGPMISEEIRAGKPAYAQCGALNSDIAARVLQLFAGTALHLEAASDIPGLSWSAILKNVYAMAFGMADELQLGDNVRGFLAVTAMHELAGLVRQMGGAADTPMRLAGLGDLITTGTSSGSHHRELGRRLARSDAGRLQGEGSHTLAVLRAARRFDTAQFPLYRLIDDCVQHPPGTADSLRAFLNRERR